MIGLARVADDEVSRYGIVAAEKEGSLLRLRHMVEKPEVGQAPSNLAMIGRYIFTPRLFELLKATRPGAGGEIQLTDAMCKLAEEEPVYGVVIEGQRFDAGNPYGFLLANATLGLQHEQHGASLRKALKAIL